MYNFKPKKGLKFLLNFQFIFTAISNLNIYGSCVVGKLVLNVIWIQF